jgi:D-serine dehydratase
MTQLEKLSRGQEFLWINPSLGAEHTASLTQADIDDADARLRRFAPLIETCFPETAASHGIIESPLRGIPDMMHHCFPDVPGNLYLKMDSDLPIAGSVKARGGIYEVLVHTEELALEHGLLSGIDDDYRKLCTPEARSFFSGYSMQVGSTGNLGMSIGIMSAAIGYKAIVHMSSDAKQWKKDKLRQNGVTVIEYDGDYGEAVIHGRQRSDSDPTSYFVDDENSKELFLGYAVSANRLPSQLEQAGIPVDEGHPLFVYIPCGVGGAPGGITFGLKERYGKHVHCFFAEPTQAPCMLAGLLTGRHQETCVQDLGLSGKTHADGLAVGRPSGFVGKIMESLLSGEYTVEDRRLYDYMRALYSSEHVFIEPSSCAAFHGLSFWSDPAMQKYLESAGISHPENITHIMWATGGSMVPEKMRIEFMDTYL